MIIPGVSSTDETIINENAVNIINELILLVGRMKKDLKTSRWIHNGLKLQQDYGLHTSVLKWNGFSHN